MSAALLAVLLPIPAISAEVINRRLLRLSSNPDLTDDGAKEVSSALEIASAIPVKLQDFTRIQVYHATKTSALKNPESGPIVKCAGDLIRYSRETIFTPRLDEIANITASSDAWTAYKHGAKYAMPVLLDTSRLPTTHRQEATDAIASFSRAIDLAAGNTDILIGCLNLRATMYLVLMQATKALQDAERLEIIGGTDLANILAIEGTALVMRAKHEDLERAVRVFTLAMQLEPPTVSLANPTGAQAPTIPLIDALGNRSRAYYKLGNFEQSLQDLKSALAALNQSGLVIPNYIGLTYAGIIAANLHLDRIDEAKSAASDWLARTPNDADAREAYSAMESQSERIRWLAKSEFTVPAD